MTDAGGFLIEDFLHAITTQLDRTQDALRAKAVNRPLTYAIKDFALELKVFVDLDPSGQVRLRAAGPNEVGASVMQIGFTTITRTMIEENTASLSVNRSPTLAELGLDTDEQQKLERLGVRNAAELQRLQTTAGQSGMSRLSSIPVDRLRQALQLGRPRLDRVDPVPPRPAPVPTPPRVTAPPRVVPAPPVAPPPVPVAPPRLPLVRVPAGGVRLRLGGENLLGAGGPPVVRLNNRVLELHAADDHELTLDLPADAAGGALEVAFADGGVTAYELSVGDPHPTEGRDPWAPTDPTR